MATTQSTSTNSQSNLSTFQPILPPTMSPQITPATLASQIADNVTEMTMSPTQPAKSKDQAQLSAVVSTEPSNCAISYIEQREDVKEMLMSGITDIVKTNLRLADAVLDGVIKEKDEEIAELQLKLQSKKRDHKIKRRWESRLVEMRHNRMVEELASIKKTLQDAAEESNTMKRKVEELEADKKRLESEVGDLRKKGKKVLANMMNAIKEWNSEDTGRAKRTRLA